MCGGVLDMYIFPKDLYVDVRIEESFDTKISFKKKSLMEQKIRKNTGAFIRVFDGKRGGTTAPFQMSSSFKSKLTSLLKWQRLILIF